MESKENGRIHVFDDPYLRSVRLKFFPFLIRYRYYCLFGGLGQNSTSVNQLPSDVSGVWRPESIPVVDVSPWT